MPIRKFRGIELLNVAAIAEKTPGLQLLVLHGSRARGDARPDSDWDFAYLADGAFDPDELLARLSEELSGGNVDLADLSRASGLLRIRAAVEGRPIHQATPDAFRNFRLDATAAWCDMEPVLRRAYDARLARATP